MILNAKHKHKHAHPFSDIDIDILERIGLESDNGLGTSTGKHDTDNDSYYTMSLATVNTSCQQYSHAN